MRYLKVVLIAGTLTLLLSNAAVSSTGEPLARKALALARVANAKASKALSRTKSSPSTVSQDTAGSGLGAVTGPLRGLPGADGQPGRDGVDGRDGAKGAAGADGARGVAGEQGPKGDAGPAGVASVNATSADNPSTVRVGVSDTTVVTLDVQTSGQAFITFDGQANGENGTADGMLCQLRADSATLTERFITVPGNAQESIAGSALAQAPQTVAVVCRVQSSVSDVEFPANRARLTVLTG